MMSLNGQAALWVMLGTKFIKRKNVWIKKGDFFGSVVSILRTFLKLSTPNQ